jgi:hypothetical protein
MRRHGRPSRSTENSHRSHDVLPGTCVKTECRNIGEPSGPDDAAGQASDVPQPHDRFLTQRELAARWRISARTLERWRWLNTGPTYTRIGGKVLYALWTCHGLMPLL